MVRITPVVGEDKAQQSLAKSFGSPLPSVQGSSGGVGAKPSNGPKRSFVSLSAEEPKVGGFDVGALNRNRSISSPSGFHFSKASADSKAAAQPKDSKATKFDIAALNCCKPKEKNVSAPAKPADSEVPQPADEPEVEYERVWRPPVFDKFGNKEEVGEATVLRPIVRNAPKPVDAKEAGEQAPPCFQQLNGPLDPQIYWPIDFGSQEQAAGSKESSANATLGSDSLRTVGLDSASDCRTAKSTTERNCCRGMECQVQMECSLKLQQTRPVPQRKTTDLWFACSFGVLLTMILMMAASYHVTYVITVQMPEVEGETPTLDVKLLRDPENPQNASATPLSEMFSVRLQNPNDIAVQPGDPIIVEKKMEIPEEAPVQKTTNSLGVHMNAEQLARMHLLEKTESVMAAMASANNADKKKDHKEVAKEQTTVEQNETEAEPKQDDAKVPKTEENHRSQLGDGDNGLPIPKSRMILD